jgi:hypothetical protein
MNRTTQGRRNKNQALPNQRSLTALRNVYDCVNFTRTNQKPIQAVGRRNKFYYSVFDEIITKYGLEKYNSH